MADFNSATMDETLDLAPGTDAVDLGRIGSNPFSARPASFARARSPG